MRIERYDATAYPFRKLIQVALNWEDLEHIHRGHRIGPVIVENNSDTDLHRRFYDKIHVDWADFETCYNAFIAEKMIPLFRSNEFVVQTHPTFRVHFPENRAVPEFHCDSQPGYDHPDGEINVQIAITRCSETNATWCESVPGLGDYSPIELEENEFAIFDGNKCRHGNYLNKTGQTRISLDFRLLPLSRYDERHSRRSATKKLKFIIGEYYKAIS